MLMKVAKQPGTPNSAPASLPAPTQPKFLHPIPLFTRSDRNWRKGLGCPLDLTAAVVHSR
jgi:hypothetical protein